MLRFSKPLPPKKTGSFRVVLKMRKFSQEKNESFLFLFFSPEMFVFLEQKRGRIILLQRGEYEQANYFSISPHLHTVQNSLTNHLKIH